MNIVFWLIVIVALILVWFCLSFAYKAVGGIGLKLFNDAKNEINEKQETEENNDER